MCDHSMVSQMSAYKHVYVCDSVCIYVCTCGWVLVCVSGYVSGYLWGGYVFELLCVSVYACL